MKKFLQGVFPLCAAAALLLTACGREELSSETRANLLGTVITVSTYEPISAEDYRAVFDIVSDIDTRMSASSADSELAAVNASSGVAPVAVSDDLYALIQEACDFASYSGGAFDPTVGAVMELWKQDGEFAVRPTDAEIEEKRPLVDYRAVVLADGAVFLPTAGMRLDLGGIAKGYACDQALVCLRERGITSALLDFGGNIYAAGTRPNGEPWRIGVTVPLAGESGQSVCALRVQDYAVVTSGGYQRYFTEDGTTYHHIIDPKTGYPAESGLLSVTILNPSSTQADALSTACFVLGLEDGMRLLEGLEGSEGIFITTDYTIYITSGLTGALTVTDDRFTLADESTK
ncbi:MAG: FAD:protein FMN transferase [Oscillospiraceae bacterium]|nr:FAD:protein FMN transferase [Oscillospiraceae bacterium]